MPAASDTQVILHASSVAHTGRALLILGAAGCGKSTLALQMMGYGAGLVSDDRVCVTRRDDQIWADAPVTITGVIEARGIGLLHAAPVGETPVVAVIDLDAAEPERLPPRRDVKILGLTLPVFHNSEMTDVAAALVQYLKGGMVAEGRLPVAFASQDVQAAARGNPTAHDPSAQRKQLTKDGPLKERRDQGGECTGPASQRGSQSKVNSKANSTPHSTGD